MAPLFNVGDGWEIQTPVFATDHEMVDTFRGNVEFNIADLCESSRISQDTENRRMWDIEWL